jgi:hypothetical protein
MADALITVGGHAASRIELHVPGVGPWFVDADMADAAEGVTGRVAIVIGELSLSGTVRASASGTFGDRRRVRVVAGADGWGTLVERKSYHNDAGIKASVVAEDAARAAGETIGSFAGAAERLAADYVRPAGPASAALESAARGAAWWVDYTGATHVGVRPTTTAESGTYSVLQYDPRHREAVLTADDLTKIGIGSVLSDRLDEPLTIRSFEAVVDSKGARVTAWCPAEGGRQSQIADSVRAIVSRLTDSKIHGVWRYRVVNMKVDRVDVQAIRAAAGLPDLLTISMWPGAAGAHALLTPGAEVLVQFVEGDREQPVITGFSGKGAPGHVPQSLILCGGTMAVARQGDLIMAGGPGTMCTLMPVSGVGAPPNNAIVAGIPCFISFDTTPPAPPGLTAKPLYGSIQTGSPFVKS